MQQGNELGVTKDLFNSNFTLTYLVRLDFSNFIYSPEISTLRTSGKSLQFNLLVCQNTLKQSVTPGLQT